MPDDDGTTTTTASANDAGAGTTASGQVSGDGQASQAGAGDQSGADSTDDKGLDAAEAAKLRRELAEVRKEAADRRVKLKEYEDAQLSSTQKLEKERDEERDARTKAEDRARELQVRVVALDLGVRKDAAADVARLLDLDAVDTTDEKAVEKAIRELLKEKSYLSGRPDGLDGGANRNGREKQATGLTEMLLQRSGR